MPAGGTNDDLNHKDNEANQSDTIKDVIFFFPNKDSSYIIQKQSV
jgi:hypothetical protein